MAVGHSDLLQPPSELMLDKGGIDLLMQRHAAHNMFDDMSIKEVIWDEENQHMFDHYGLLKQLAQGDNYSVSEVKKPNVEQPTYDVLTHVSGAPCLLELGIEAVHEFAETPECETPECVEFMNPVTSKGDTQEVSDGMCTEGRATSLADEATFLCTSKLFECAAVEVFNEISLGDVIWDKEVQHGPNSHGLLPRLADDQKYLDVEAMMPVTEQIILVANGKSLFPEYNQANTDQMSDEIPDEVVWDEPLYSLDAHDDYMQQDSLYKEYWVGKDILVDQNLECHVCEANKLMIEAPMDELNIDAGALVLLKLGMASVDVLYDKVSQLHVVCDDALLHNLDSQDELVQQEAQIDECLVVDNKTTVDQVHCNGTFLTEFDTNCAKKLFNDLPHEVVWDKMSSTMSMHIDLLQQLVFDSKSTNCIATHSNQVIFKASIVPVGAAHLVFDGMDFGDISNCVNQVMVQAAISPGLPDQRLVMHSNLLEKSVWELNIEQGHNGTNFSNQELNYDSENLVTWEQMQGYHELSPWRLNALSPHYYNTEIAWSWFSPWSKHTRAHKQQQLELYRMPERQWDPDILGLVLINSKSVLLIDSFRRYATDVELDEHSIDVSSLQKALGLQIQHHLSANENERTIVLKEIRLSLVLYFISWCTVLKYRAFKCQNLCELYKFKQDDTSHGEDILEASGLNQFLTWTVWRCISHVDANCAADLVLEDMIFGVLIIDNLSAEKICSSLLINDSLCISVLHLDARDSLVIISIMRPWDPGVKSFLTKFKGNAELYMTRED